MMDLRAMWFISLCLLFVVIHGESQQEQQRPNIIFMFADDWGFNDVGWHSNTNTETSFLDELALTESIILKHNYVSPLCTISRASLLTGRYPFRYGMQHYVLKPQSKYGLTTQNSLISNEFQNAGFSTHIIGKWHLGMIAKEYTPTYRGFDTFHGYYLGKSHYYTHTYELSIDAYGLDVAFKDLRLNEDVAGDSFDGDFGPFWQRDRVLDILESKSTTTDEPFFMYVGWQASHSPSESEESLFNKYNIDDKLSEEDLEDDENNWVRRYNMQAQTTSLDNVMEDIVTYLKESGLWDNTILVFSSDNGGESDYGDNAPLRGAKNTYWEGGIKVPAFVSGGLIPNDKKGTYFDDVSYVCDWYPTLMSFAGLDYSESSLIQSSMDSSVDGVNLHYKLFGIENENKNVFENEIENEDENREIVLGLNSHSCDYSVCGAIRYGNYKYMIGGQLIYWNDDNLFTPFWDRRYALDPDSNQEIDTFQCGNAPVTVYDLGFESDEEYIKSNVEGGITDDNSDGIERYSNNCDSETGCLFDLSNDACEYVDISKSEPELAKYLKSRLLDYESNYAVTPLYDSYGDYDMRGYSYDNIPPMVDENGYWGPFIDSSQMVNNELEFEASLRQEKMMLSKEDVHDKNDKVLESDRSFLGTPTSGSAFDFGSMEMRGVFYAFLVILLIAMIFMGLLLYGRRKEWQSRQKRRGSALLNRFTVALHD